MSGEKTMFECVVSADLFRRAMLGVSKEETRYYLNGVFVSPSPEGGAVLVATDGSLLVCFRDPDAFVSGEAIIKLEKPMQQALAVSGVLLEKRLLAVRVLQGGRGRGFVLDQPRPAAGDDTPSEITARTVFDDPDRRVKAAQFGPINIDGNFPDWRNVLPTKLAPSAPLPIFDQRKLAIIASALCDKREGRLSIVATGDAPGNAPLLITPLSRARQSFAILMPTRDEARSDAVPSWALPGVKKAA